MSRQPATQPPTKPHGVLLRLLQEQRQVSAHPWRSDHRRCTRLFPAGGRALPEPRTEPAHDAVLHVRGGSNDPDTTLHLTSGHHFRYRFRYRQLEHEDLRQSRSHQRVVFPSNQYPSNG